MYLLDTNIISDIRKGLPKAVNWLRSTNPAGNYLSVITLGEIERGIAKKERSDRAAAGHLKAWLSTIRTEQSSRILPIDDEVALAWGRISAQRPRGEADGLIAATALVHNLVLVTKNVADFHDTGVAVLDPWEGWKA
ncbi:type II toxin-antitoxin system VapC family toxin [Mesorhizobium sp. 1B3]|uniref:type II toxin-antitoxin system VapC family toxin n=1 Tax=Mesorhizobium sp. 1B3 TaxID=3243599 RepID=UPI003D97A208